MIVHRHSDDSEGYEYEIGDVVVIFGTVGGGWSNHSVGSTGRVERLTNGHWRIAPLYVRHSTEWGPSYCMPWQIRPTDETRATATVVSAYQDRGV
jgi:hypothetical protein